MNYVEWTNQKGRRVGAVLRSVRLFFGTMVGVDRAGETFYEFGVHHVKIIPFTFGWYRVD